MVDVVSELTRRYKQRRVTPHLFRDILAFKWLDGHPEDYLTLSKVLWHRDINTTLRIYGCKFDESHGLRRVEEWLDREQEQKYLPHAAAAEGSADLGTESHSEQVRLQPGIMQKISNLASKSDAFQALPPAAKQRELSAIASIIEAHPWLTKLFGYELRKEAVGTSQESGFRAIRRKLAA